MFINAVVVFPVQSRKKGFDNAIESVSIRTGGNMGYACSLLNQV